MQKFDTKTFQGLILTLQDYWARQGCTIVQPLDMEVGAGTSHPMTSLRALGPEPMATAYVQPSRRPTDGRYGENPNRLQHYYQFQVVIKPSPDNIQELYLGSLKELGMDPTIHDIRFVEDNWENPTLGAWGLGWEVWLNGMEVTQFTYFQQVGGLECKPITGEITYGLERLAMYIQGVDSVYDLVWSDGPLGKTTYGDVFHQNEVEQSTYNFEYADVDFLFSCFEQYEKEAQEIGTEELPPKALRSLAESFAANVTAELDNAGLAHGKIEWFAAPRRLALKVANLAASQPDREVEKRGPAIAQAFDAEGKPSKAAEGWARGCGITVDQAERLTTDKGEWLLYRAHVKGESAEALLPDMIATSLAKLPIPKLMRWGASDVHFVRPVHTVTLLLGDTVIPATILGVASDRVIRGHRFMGEPEFTIDNADQYPQILLERGKVIADYEQRKAKIKADAEEAARKIGGNADLSDSLLEEVTSLVEWPVVLTAKFEEKFLAVPAEALVYTMKGDQKYFPVYANDGQLLPNFIFVANIESKDPSQIISGNEKVVRPRLADAEFFFNTDRKKRLEDNLPRLQTVLFQQQLGTLRDKTDRIAELSGWIAREIGADVNHATRAGLLSKCDLMTNMVFEFTDTQGVMGMHYARHDGEAEDVAVALNEQYQPRFAGDDLPSNPVACAVAIADKMDTLAGIFGIGQHPKGDKDPFALRRAALGVLRIIVEKNLNLDLQTLTEEAVRLYGDKLTNAKVVDDVIDFMLGRFRAWYQDEGYSVDTIQAVLARRPTRPADFDARMKAVSHFRTLEAASALAAANKRVSNILAKSDETLNERVNAATLKEPEEISLAMQVVVLRDKLEPYFAEGRYQEALVELAELRDVIDAFFEKVMVNVEDKELRINRLSMLEKLRELFLRVADISLLQ